MAKLGSDGVWTDYIYANGEKVAMVGGDDHRLHRQGTICGGGGGQFSVLNLPAPSANSPA